jgi:2,3,4,5-tetrahydropyridine-2-carboxylate N-succinyltransferase
MLQSIIENAWNDRSLLQNQGTKTAILNVIEQLDKGKIRVAEPFETGWKVNDWVKKAVIMYFPINENIRSRSF